MMFDPDLKAKFEETLQYFVNEGATVEYVSMDKKLLHAIYPTYIIISCAEATSNNACIDGVKYGVRKDGKTYQEIMINSRTAGFSELIRRRFIIGSFSLLKANQKELFIKAQKCRRMIVDAYNNILKDYDAVYTPASPTIAPKFGQTVGDNLSGDFLAIDNHLGIANFAGLPSLTLPIGFKENMPFGANLTCKAFEEAKLFNIAKKLENQTGFANIYAKKEEK
jgi:aspartyl-tRNA(Asn)/glutamyl-tRNA(Gln) amidotransferase subunit A